MVMPTVPASGGTMIGVAAVDLVPVQQHTHRTEPVPAIISNMDTPTRYSTVDLFGGAGGACGHSNGASSLFNF